MGMLKLKPSCKDYIGGGHRLAEEDGKAELCCHFCPSRYTFPKEELLGMIAEKTLDTREDL